MAKSSSNTSNESLYRRIKGNDYNAFEKVFRENYENLYLFAENYVADKAIAEDIIQNVFLKLWELDKPDDILNLKAYLYRSTKNACISHLSRLQMIDKHKNKLAEALVYSQTLESEEDPELQRRIKAAIEKLPAQSQTIIYYKIYEGLKNEEIANKMNLSVNTVKTHIFRAYKILRKHLSVLYLITVFFK